MTRMEVLRPMMIIAGFTICALFVAPLVAKEIPKADKTIASVKSTPQELCCAAVCEKRFAQSKTKSETWFACHRGCRFFALIELLSDGQTEKGIQSSCLSACSEAYNETNLEVACQEGCNNQKALKPHKAKAAANGNSVRLPMSPEAWAPGFVFRIGWSHSSRGEDKSHDERSLPDFANPLRMFRDFFSGFINRLATPSEWTSKSSVTYLLGKGANGKEEMVLLPDDSDSLIQAKEPCESTEVEVTSKPSTTHKPKVLVTPATPTVKARVIPAPYLVGSTHAMDHKDKKLIGTERTKKGWWDCLTNIEVAATPSWVPFALLSALFLIVAWICSTTHFMSNYIYSNEGSLRARGGYIRIPREDPRAKGLDDEIDEFSEDDDFFYLPLPKEEREQQNREGPPSYEEAQQQCLLIDESVPDFTVLLPPAIGSEKVQVV